MKFAFIHTQIATSHDQRTGWTVSALCRILCVSRSGYGAWQRRQHQVPTQAQQTKLQEEARLMLLIRAAYRKGRCYYGSPRVYDELRDQGIHISRKRVARLMQQEKLVGRSRRRGRIATTDSRHTHPVAGNLLDRCWIAALPLTKLHESIAFGVVTSPICQPEKVGYIWPQ